MFTPPPYINFLKYNGQSFSSGSVMMTRMHTTVQNFEVYFIFVMPLTYMFIFENIMEHPIPMEAS